MNSKEQNIFDALSKKAKEHNVEIVLVEAIGSKKSPIVRIYIDIEGGINSQDIIENQGWISEILDELDPYPGAYQMEVSSPGIDRPLRTKEHFNRFIGEETRISLNSAIDQRINFKGLIKEATDSIVLVECDGTTFEIPYKNIKRANLIGKIEF